MRVKTPGHALVVVALAALVGAGAALRHNAAHGQFAPDQCQRHDVYRYYVSTAESLLAGGGFVTDYSWNFVPPPLQGLFVAFVRTLHPRASYGDIRQVQAWLAALCVPLAFWIGLQLGGLFVGLLAAALIAFDPDLVHAVGILLAESNGYVLLFAFLGVLLQAVRRASVPLLAASGALLGLTSLMKPSPMFLVLLVPAWWLLHRRDRRSLAGALAFALGFAVLVLPWSVRNHQRYGQFILISSNGGTAFAMGNHRDLDATRTLYWDEIERSGAWKSAEIEARFAERLDRYGQRDWNERDRAYLRHALGYAARHPGHFLRNYAVKLYNVFRHPLPEGGRWGPVHYFRVTLILLGLPGLAWFAWVERGRPETLLVWIVLYYATFTALFHIPRSGRLNLPVKVLLGFFAAYLVVELTRALSLRLRSKT